MSSLVLYIKYHQTVAVNIPATASAGVLRRAVCVPCWYPSLTLTTCSCACKHARASLPACPAARPNACAPAAVPASMLAPHCLHALLQDPVHAHLQLCLQACSRLTACMPCCKIQCVRTCSCACKRAERSFSCCNFASSSAAPGPAATPVGRLYSSVMSRALALQGRQYTASEVRIRRAV
jgi:hypothetical protein